ncbi:MAG: type II secretion system protein [Candidatus Rifleibacteriota bacterium]
MPDKSLQICKSNIVDKSGVTLVEILIVTAIIAMMAAISFPVYKIIQQREKEKLLKKYLLNMRSAINGYQGSGARGQSVRIKYFNEGYRGFIIERGINEIHNKNSGATRKQAVRNFLASGTSDGLFYPKNIASLTPQAIPFEVKIATASPAIADPGDYVTITVDRPFLRNIPPHPFKDWYPGADWEFKSLDPATIGPEGSGNYIIDVYSQGAGSALNGSDTDDW